MTCWPRAGRYLNINGNIPIPLAYYKTALRVLCWVINIYWSMKCCQFHSLQYLKYRKTSYISRTLVGNKIQCLPFYIINEVGHLTTSVDHLAEFCQNYHLAAICTQLMVEFFLQLRFIQYFDCKCMKIPDFSRIDSHFVAQILILGSNGLHQLNTTSHLLWVRGNTEIVDNSDVVGASPVGAAPTTSSFST